MVSMQFSITSRLCRIAMIASSYALVRVDVGGWVGDLSFTPLRLNPLSF